MFIGFQPTSIRIPSTGGVALPNTPFNRVNPYNPQLRNAYANNPFSIPRYNTPFINNPNTNGNVNNQNKNNWKTKRYFVYNEQLQGKRTSLL